ncbi:MAG: phosphatidate cytidylyltransferase [Cyanobacteria bacterium P01_C01_bin.69]
MHPIFVYTLCFLLVGAVGMGAANRKVDAQTGRRRWLKFGTYIVIVGSAIAAILLDHFCLLAILITTVGFWEILKNITTCSSPTVQNSTLGGYLLITIGFLSFSTIFSPFFLLFIYFQVFVFDGFSQVCGQVLGKHQLLPRISPGKTLEGLVGGTVFCVVAGAIARDWVHASLMQALIISLSTAILAFTGDILASAVKRLAQVKDYSNLLPGHGGFLDRFDSFMMAGTGYAILLNLGLLTY